MELEASCSNDDLLCSLCNKNQRRYSCPRCHIAYCSVECYKSTNHLECSEAFYKQCVEEELQMQQCDPQTRHRTLEMLQRIYNQETDDDILSNILKEDENGEYDYEADLDSDDENLPSLEKRLKNINLDNADELWGALTVTERQEFEALISSGEASKLLPSWNPWWMYTEKKKLVQDLSQQNPNLSFKDNCPKILDTPSLEAVKVSPFIRYSIINSIYAYAYSVMYFNGEHHSNPLDATYVFLRICDTIRMNRIYKDSSSAVESVLLQITNCDALPGDQDTILGTKEAGDSILNGPNIENKSFYIVSALSDLYHLVQEAKKEVSSSKFKSTNNEFKSKFQSDIGLSPTEISKKNFPLILKKIEFYITWLKSKNEIYDITEGESVQY